MITLSSPALGPVELGLRPENMDVTADPDGVAVVTDVQFFGHDQLVALRVGDGPVWHARTWPRGDLRPGERARVDLQGVAFAFPVNESGQPQEQRVQASL